MPGVEVRLGYRIQGDAAFAEPLEERCGLGDLLSAFLRRVGAQGPFKGLGPELAELVPAREVVEESSMFGTLGGGEPFGEPPLEEQEPAIDARENAAVHQQVTEVGDRPPAREVLKGFVGERNMFGGEVA
ncbi:hypothetical protein ABR737_07895 [Streptomyces sp. Edi2]|uniref:hypothetical protein n=1 Tax=Streptomyces sp. Edi2 TaxID=3162528 RepID=UPI00330661C7